MPSRLPGCGPPTRRGRACRGPWTHSCRPCHVGHLTATGGEGREGPLPEQLPSGRAPGLRGGGGGCLAPERLCTRAREGL